MEELNVKVGDKLLFTSIFQGTRTEKITKVIKVTPTGRIRVEIAPEIQFNKDGSERGRLRGIYTLRSLSILTPEKEKELNEAAVIRRCRAVFDKTDLTYKQAQRILSILRADEENKANAGGVNG